MEFTLDLNKWRCGGSKLHTRFGHGETYLENNQGFQCCLGQWSIQIDRQCNILGESEPEDVSYVIPIDKNPFLTCSDLNSKLTAECIDVNDSEKTTIKQKIKKLTSILKKYGHSLKIKNDKLFDTNNRLINIKLLTNSVYRYHVSEFLLGYLSSKDFSSINCFTRELIRKKGVEKSKEILKNNLEKFI